LAGGDFVRGAIQGAWTSAIADVCNRLAHSLYYRWYYDSYRRAFLEEVRKTNPVEYALFVEYAKSVDTELWTYDSRWDEIAVKKFDNYAQHAAADLISKNFQGIYKGIYGPIGVVTKYFSGTVSMMLGTYSDFSTAAGLVSLVQIQREATNIMIYGPSVINESYWYEYTPGLD
jgi:hypothetical protein